LNIAICDDIPTQLDILDVAIRKCSIWKNEELSVDRFTDGNSLVNAVNSGMSYSFIFLDIQMPKISGLKVFNRLDKSDTAIVFVSTHIELLPEALALRPLGFLPKPYTQDVFDRTIKSVMIQRANKQYFTYFSDGKKNTIACTKISYFKVNSHYIYMHDMNGKTITIYGLTLRDVEDQLAKQGFFRCNKSLLVNLRFCEERMNNKIKLKVSEATDDITISRRNIKEYDKQYLIYKWR